MTWASVSLITLNNNNWTQSGRALDFIIAGSFQSPIFSQVKQ